MHPEILLAARMALGLTQGEIASAAGIGVRTLSDLEGGRPSSVETYLLVQQALQSQGIAFLSSADQLGPGFRLPAGWKGNPFVRPRRTRRKRS